MSSPVIRIILNPDKTTSFSPSTQKALFGDLVFWRNETQETHQPWPADSNYNPVVGNPWFPPVPPGETSGDYATPAAIPSSPPQSPQTIYYCCKIHPQRTSERGTINVVTKLP